MKVVLTEKPSVARDIAAFLGAKSRHDGYYEGNDYQVTWALGHLVGLKEPEDYDPALKTWSLHTLPFVPEKFGLKLRGDQQARRQFFVVKRLFRNASQIICATDAGREGELISLHPDHDRLCEEASSTSLAELAHRTGHSERLSIAATQLGLRQPVRRGQMP